MDDDKQNGNVLFLILIAVALFAALSYAVTQSSRGGGNADSEVRALTASKLDQIIANINVGIQRLHLKGCAYEDISFYSTLYGTPSDFDNANTPVAGGDFSCHLFNPEGGGISWFGEDMSDEICTAAGCGSVTITFSGDFSIDGVGTSDAELIMIIDGFEENLCDLYNERIGITGDPPVDTADLTSSDYFVGSFEDSSPKVIGDDASEFSGQYTGCYNEGAYLNFYSVLVAR